MGNRFVGIVCELEGIDTPEVVRMRELEKVIVQQVFDEYMTVLHPESYHEICDKIYDEVFCYEE
jgi:hypothetical protein